MGTTIRITVKNSGVHTRAGYFSLVAAFLCLIFGATAAAMTADDYFEDGNRLFRDDLYFLFVHSRRGSRGGTPDHAPLVFALQGARDSGCAGLLPVPDLTQLRFAEHVGYDAKLSGLSVKERRRRGLAAESCKEHLGHDRDHR